MVYYLIATQLVGKEESVNTTWEEVRQNIGIQGTQVAQIDSELSKFKIGNLDSLMYLNENMIKLENQIEALLKKIDKQQTELSDQQVDKYVETKEGKSTLQKFISTFKWDEAKFSRNNTLQDIMKTIQNRMNTIDTDIRQKTTMFQEAKNAQSNLTKKDGNILTKDICEIIKEGSIKPTDFVYSDNLTTLIAIVPNSQLDEFLRKCDNISNYVVPSSHKKLAIEDQKDSQNYSIWRIILFKRDYLKKKNNDDVEEINDQNKKNFEKQKSPVEEYITICRDQLKVQIREYEFKADEAKDKQKQKVELSAKLNSLTGILKQSCEKCFSELYITYIHLKRLRLIVDIAMRFGVTNKICTFNLIPSPGKEKKIQQQLLTLFSSPDERGYYGTKEELEDTEDFFPFVFIQIPDI